MSATEGLLEAVKLVEEEEKIREEEGKGGQEEAEKLERLIEEVRLERFQLLAFDKENVIHTLHRTGYLAVVRGVIGATTSPLTVDEMTIPIPADYVYVLYDVQVDCSPAYKGYLKVWSDGTLWFINYTLPPTFKWSTIGYPPTKKDLKLWLMNTDPVNTLSFLATLRFLKFGVDQWVILRKSF